MRARTKRRPGEPGTKAFVELYGDRLVCVRYRYDAERRRRYTTVEIIVSEGPWEPPRKAPAPETLIFLRVAWGEVEVARQIKAAGGMWRRDLRLWSITYGQAAQLGLHERIVDPPAP